MDKKILNWGLIGAGDIARKRIAPALRDLPNCNLVSVSRSRFELAEEFAREFGARKWLAEIFISITKAAAPAKMPCGKFPRTKKAILNRVCSASFRQRLFMSDTPKNVTFDNIRVSFQKEDFRPAFVLDNVHGVDFDRLKIWTNQKLFSLRNVTGFNLTNSLNMTDTKIEKVEKREL